jgi:hypothetical protein
MRDFGAAEAEVAALRGGACQAIHDDALAASAAEGYAGTDGKEARKVPPKGKLFDLAFGEGQQLFGADGVDKRRLGADSYG